MIEFHFFARSCPDVPTPFVEEAIFAPLYAPASFVKYSLTKKTWVYFWALCSVPLVYVPVFMPLPGCFDYSGRRQAYLNSKSFLGPLTIPPLQEGCSSQQKLKEIKESS